MDSFLLLLQRVVPGLLQGTRVTLQYALIALALGSVLGLLAALGRVYGHPWLQRVAGIYIGLFRGTPLLIQLFMVYYGLPDAGLTLSRFSAAVLTLGFNSGAYQAEYFRGGIQAVGRGQMLAARAIGMSRLKAIRFIILPQALRLALPAWSNEMVSMIKYTAVIFLIAVPDLMGQAKRLSRPVFRPHLDLPHRGRFLPGPRRHRHLAAPRPRAPAADAGPGAGDREAMIHRRVGESGCTRIELPFGAASLGSGVLPVTIPDAWLGEVVAPRPVAPAADPGAVVAAALASPIGSLPLEGLVHPGQRVAVLVDDHTRKTPVQQLLPPLLATLAAAGAGPDRVRIVIALGTHRPMTPAEIAARLGDGVASRYEVVNVPATEESAFVYMGTCSNGIEAWVNRAVAEAGLRIGVGMITPHVEAGFSGGAKIVLPGVCSARTVDGFHRASAFVDGNPLGSVEAPLRRHLEQLVCERVPLHFILNAVPALSGDLYRCVAGDPILAHRAGTGFAREVFGAPVRRRYPVVVANCYPYDLDLWQSIKGAGCGELLCADGGTLIVVTAAPEGNSNYPLVPAYAGRDPDDLRREILAGQVKEPMQAATGVMFGRLRRRVRLALVSPGLGRQDAAAMGADYYDSVEEAVAAAVARLPMTERQGAVAIVPQAGILLPLPSASPDRELATT